MAYLLALLNSFKVLCKTVIGGVLMKIIVLLEVHVVYVIFGMSKYTNSTNWLYLPNNTCNCFVSSFYDLARK